MSKKATVSILELAAAQHGVVSRRQLISDGIPGSLIDGRIANYRLISVFRGVYALGTGMLDRRGRWMAAVLAGGSGAVLSHRSAATLHGLTAPGSVAIEVLRRAASVRRAESLPAVDGRRFTVMIRATRVLPQRDRTIVDGIPVASVSRTLLDLGAVVNFDRLRAALNEAERLRVANRIELAEVAGRGKGWEGSKALRRALEEFDPTEVWTRSELEIAMKRLCGSIGIPEPQVDVPVEGFVADFIWPEARLIVEVDGFGNHGRFFAFQGDRRRDVDLTIARYRVARFTYGDVMRHAPRTAEKLKALLAQQA